MNQDQLLEIGLQKRKNEITESWQQLALKHGGGTFTDGETYRLWVKGRLRRKNSVNGSKDQVDKPDNFKETHQIHPDGSQSSHKLLKMSIEQKKDTNFLLQAHGYDIESWELVTANSNIWNAYSKQDGIMQLYGSKITVKPRKHQFTFEQLITVIKNTGPVTYNRANFTISNKRLSKYPSLILILVSRPLRIMRNL